jgi:hypothetical protein
MIKNSSAILLAFATKSIFAMDINNKPLVEARIRTIGATDSTPCFDLPGALVTCGSHCWPNCDTHSGSSYPKIMDFNHYIVIPEARSCYIDTIDYGRFDAFLSKYSKLNITIDTYVAQDGVCVLNEKNAQLDPGSLAGDNYCQVFMQVEMDECDNCPDYQRRIEVYSNRDTGCGLEFYVEPEVVEPEPVDPVDPVTPDPDTTDPDTVKKPTTPGGNEDTGSNSLATTSILAVFSAILLTNY